MALYNCDACASLIQAFQPRIQCIVCPNFDLCAGCALGEKFGDASHTAAHNVRTFKASGTAQGGQILAQAWIVYASNTPALANTPLPPLLGRQSTSSSAPIPSPHFSPTAFSPSYNAQPHQPQYQSPSQYWQPFFNPADMSPTPTYVTVMNAIFTHLDSSRAGYLTPELFSRFEDDMGYTIAENVWKSNLANGPVRADAALTAAFQAFNIEYTTHPRVGAPVQSNNRNNNRSSISGFLSTLATPPSMLTMANPAQSQPLLTRRGFADIAAVEFLSDPTRSHGGLVGVLRRYQIRELMAWGEMPRSVLPAEPDARMLARVRGVGERAQESARMQARANRAAVEAVGGRYDYVHDSRYI